MYYCAINSPVGKLLLAGRCDALQLVSFQGGAHPTPIDPDWKYDESPFRDAIDQLKAYFTGKLKTFTLKLKLEGTAFQQRVWQQLRSIPYGQTVSYGQIAQAVGNPKASRAVGAANGKNPISIVVPCHRVIGSGGKLVGFGGGLSIKETLLSLERNTIGDSLPGLFSS